MPDPHHAQSSAELPEENKLNFKEFPLWLPVILVILGFLAYLIGTDENYNETYTFIIRGIGVTIKTSLISYAFAMVLGLLAGLGRISRNIIIRNIATLYVELIRGIPMIVLIFYVTLVIVPLITDFLTDNLSGTLTLFGVDPEKGFIISMNNRAIVALSVTYGAFLAEIFRAGIQSIGAGQMEAARSLGMSYGQAMRYIILPQAIRNVLPALGNDFIAMVKDSALVMVLGVRDLTQSAKIFAGSTFRYREAYNLLAALYLSMTVALSFALKAIESAMDNERSSGTRPEKSMLFGAAILGALGGVLPWANIPVLSITNFMSGIKMTWGITLLLSGILFFIGMTGIGTSQKRYTVIGAASSLIMLVVGIIFLVTIKGSFDLVILDIDTVKEPIESTIQVGLGVYFTIIAGVLGVIGGIKNVSSTGSSTL